MKREEYLDFLSKLGKIKIWGIKSKKSTYYEKGTDLSDYTHRNQLDNEIVFELDYPELEKNADCMKRIVNGLTKMKIPFNVFYSGNKSFHIVILINVKDINFRNKAGFWILKNIFSEQELDLMVICGYLDMAFFKNNHPIKLLGYPHDKTKQPFKLITPFNSFVWNPAAIEKEIYNISFTKYEDLWVSITRKRKDKKYYKWIEGILKEGLKDKNKRFQSFVVIPYFVTILELSEEEAIGRLKEYRSKIPKYKGYPIGQLRSLYRLRKAQEWLPLTKEKWEII